MTVEHDEHWYVCLDCGGEGMLDVQVSDDPEFASGVTTLYNNDHDNSSGLGLGKDKEYIETNEGRLIDAKGAKGRYLRFYSNGNSTNELNRYVEIEVYGAAQP